MKKISMGTYRELCDCYGGICLSCGELRWEGCEPDAEDYACDACEEHRVMGIENALISGEIEFE